MLKNDLAKKILITFFMMLVLAVGQQIYLPLVDASFASSAVNKSTLLSVLGMTTGGRMTVPAIMSLGLSPYMTSMIIWQAIVTMDIKKITNMSLKNQGQIQNILTLIMAVVQAYTMILTYHSFIQPLYLTQSGIDISAPVIMLVMVAGGMFSTWLAMKNTQVGIGGSAIMIVPGIAVGLPQLLENGWTTGDVLTMTPINLMIAIFVTLLFVLAAVAVFHAELRIKLERPMLDSEFNYSYLPIKLLTGGAMPFMFSTVLFNLPMTIVSSTSLRFTTVGKNLLIWTQQDNWRGILVYGVIVMILGYGFGYMNLKPIQTIKQLKESGDYIFGCVPGEDTRRYVMRHFWLLTSIGNVALMLMAVVPLIIGIYFEGYANYSLYLGSVFILVTIFDTISQQFRALYAKNAYSVLLK